MQDVLSEGRPFRPAMVRGSESSRDPLGRDEDPLSPPGRVYDLLPSELQRSSEGKLECQSDRSHSPHCTVKGKINRHLWMSCGGWSLRCPYELRFIMTHIQMETETKRDVCTHGLVCTCTFPRPVNRPKEVTLQQQSTFSTHVVVVKCCSPIKDPGS